MDKNIDIKIIAIEGNIGSGKSTLLNELNNQYYNNDNNIFDKSLEIMFLCEPVNEWNHITDEKGTTILEKFYNDQTKYAFSFQMLAYISRLKLLKNLVQQIKSGFYSHFNKYVIITERSLYTDRYVFAKMLYDSGKIEYVNYQIYINWFNTFIDDYPIHKVIYVKTCPEICIQRIQKRNRDCENNIQFDYIKLCDKYHENMIDKITEKNKLLILNGNCDIFSNESEMENWIVKISEFINAKDGIDLKC